MDPYWQRYLVVLGAMLLLGLGNMTPLDSFDRANVGPPPSSQWTTGIVVGQCGLKVVGNVVVSDTAGNCSSWWNATSFPPDQEATIQWSDATAASGAVRLYLRLETPGTAGVDGYVCQAEPAPGNAMYLRRLDNGTLSGILAQNISVTWNAGDTVGCTIQGTQFCGWRKAAGSDAWTSLICFTDATYTAGGFAGAGFNIVDLSGDNFWAGTPRLRRQMVVFQ